MQLHVASYRLQQSKSKFRVQPVRVACQQNPASHSLQGRMLHDAFQQPPTQSTATMGVQHENVAEVRDGGEIADHPGKPNLAARTIINPKAQGMLDATRYR